MKVKVTDYVWEIRNPEGGMLGMEFAKGVMVGGQNVILAHSLPQRIDIEVRSGDGALVAKVKNLADAASAPMARLRIEGDHITRANVWPTEDDLGLPVILAGGEVAILCEWWHAEDHREWRWKVELSNHA